MNNEDSFNTIYREVTKDVNLFQEGVFSAIGKAAKGTVNFAKDFSTGFQQGMKGQWSIPKEKADTIGFKNPPKKGQILVTQQGDIKIYGKVLSSIDSKTGQWDIEILNKNPDATYSYFQTTKYPEGIITTLDQLLTDHIDPNNKQPSQQQQPQQQLPLKQVRKKPKDGEEINTPNSGINVYNAASDKWIIKNTNKPNPASGSLMNGWKNLEQSKVKKQNDAIIKRNKKAKKQNKTINKRWKITYGTGAEYPAMRCAVGFNTRYPNWTDEKETLKRY